MKVNFKTVQSWQKQDVKEKIDFLSIGNILTVRDKTAYEAGHKEGFDYALKMLKLHHGLEVNYK